MSESIAAEEFDDVTAAADEPEPVENPDDDWHDEPVLEGPDEWVLNVNEGRDTLHPAPREECNTDDAKDKEKVDRATALAMLTKGTALCRHCGPSAYPPH